MVLDSLADTSWTTRAACTPAVGATTMPTSNKLEDAGDLDAMFVSGAAQRDARQVCFACPVRMECLVEAFEARIEYGVWGGLTERERRAMVREADRNGDVTCWRERLESDEALRLRFETELEKALSLE